ncbi:putative aminopeptidase [Roseivirga pacifica]|uniref:Putative aminopeptidase n=1 Tax=Roseivirga pacifica TaxID=1267423 RepID=A0A1I0NV78_9BACT|nr:aminopeptidase [Roseivirga pacifica]RKQ51491.1 putative aminopeptidase [Roseivirga pacifica]SEW05656.1 Putative aminopeptidase [Roseivirga pacifica]
MKLKKIIGRTLLGLLLVIVVLAVIYRDLVGYGWMQLQGQLKVVREAVPLEEFVALPTTTEEQKEKIKIIQEAKQFAFGELGINYSENYSTIFDQEGKPSMFVVTACDPYSFRSHLWNFPVVGRMPYKGYFIREKAIAEYENMKEQGYDAGLRTAGGWSTLGWFQDPVLSNMLNRSEGDLASLIIHELTHGTLFVKDSVTFNENLATFIGDNGAVLFLENKYGKGSEAVTRYQNQLADEITFKQYMLGAAKALDSLYKGMNETPDATKQKLKAELIERIKVNYDTLNFLFERYSGYFSDFTPNNTFFMSMLRYNAQQDVFKKEMDEKFNGNLKAYLEYLKEKYPSV